MNDNRFALLYPEQTENERRGLMIVTDSHAKHHSSWINEKKSDFKSIRLRSVQL